MSPARSWRSASHAAGSHDWFPPKNWGPGPPEKQDKVDTICTVPLDCGTPTTRRLYPFGAIYYIDQFISCISDISTRILIRLCVYIYIYIYKINLESVFR